MCSCVGHYVHHALCLCENRDFCPFDISQSSARNYSRSSRPGCDIDEVTSAESSCVANANACYLCSLGHSESYGWTRGPTRFEFSAQLEFMICVDVQQLSVGRRQVAELAPQIISSCPFAYSG